MQYVQIIYRLWNLLYYIIYVIRTIHATATTQNAWIDNTLEHQTHQINGSLTIQDYPIVWECCKKIEGQPDENENTRKAHNTPGSALLLLFEGKGLYTHTHTS